MATWTLVAVALLSTATLAVAQATAPAPAPPATRPDLTVLDRAIARARADWDVPGLAVAIVKDGEVVLAKVRSVTCHAERKRKAAS